MNHSVDVGPVDVVLLIPVLSASGDRRFSVVKLAMVHAEHLWCGIIRVPGHRVFCYFLSYYFP